MCICVFVCIFVCVCVLVKGDLYFCDNWRSISLLEVMGKLFAAMLNDRLQLVHVVENSLRFSVQVQGY